MAISVHHCLQLYRRVFFFFTSVSKVHIWGFSACAYAPDAAKSWSLPLICSSWDSSAGTATGRGVTGAAGLCRPDQAEPRRDGLESHLNQRWAKNGRPGDTSASEPSARRNELGGGAWTRPSKERQARGETQLSSRMEEFPQTPTGDKNNTWQILIKILICEQLLCFSKWFPNGGGDASLYWGEKNIGHWNEWATMYSSQSHWWCILLRPKGSAHGCLWLDGFHVTQLCPMATRQAAFAL